MRILAVTNLYPNPLQPYRGAFNRLQLRELAVRHDVRVIAPIAWTDELRARRRGAEALPPGRQVRRDGLLVEHPRYLFTPRVLRGCYGRFYAWSARAAFQRALAEFRPDLVFAAWAYPDGWAAVRLGHRAGLPVVVKVHGSDVLLVADYPRRRRPTAAALCEADGVVAVSRDLARRVEALGAETGRVRVVYDGVDPALFHPGPAREARARLGLDPGAAVVLFVGNLVPLKAPGAVVEACARLAGKLPNLHAYLIGHGELRADLEKQAAAPGVADRFHLVGPLPQEQLPDWYRAADVLVLPSHSEGVPCVLLEALACATPFVASRVGGIPEVAALGPSRLVPPGDGAALAAAVAEMLAAPGPADRQPAYRRSHADAAAELEEFFQQVVRGRGGGPAAPRGGDPAGRQRPAGVGR
jgi:glycosyltransferase involved in cell wall biosynthesis